MPKGIKNPRIAPNAWNLPKPPNIVREESCPLVPGQLLLVDCNEGHGFIPCFPAPGHKITQVANGTWILFVGSIDFNGAACMEFMEQNSGAMFYVGEGALPYLINIPKKTLKKGHPFKKKAGSSVGKRGGIRRKRRRVDRTKDLKKLPAPGYPG